jgi:hypothetical protein
MVRLMGFDVRKTEKKDGGWGGVLRLLKDHERWRGIVPLCGFTLLV